MQAGYFTAQIITVVPAWPAPDAQGVTLAAIAAIVATAAAYVVSRLVRSAMALSTLEAMLELVLAGGLFLAVYFLVANRLRVQEINSLLAPVIRRVRRG